METQATASAKQAEGKKSAAKLLIGRYHHQLTQGCGNTNCVNQNCATGNPSTQLGANEAAVVAIRLMRTRAPLCEQSTVDRTITIEDMEVDSSLNIGGKCLTGTIFPGKAMEVLDEEKLSSIIKECTGSKDFSKLKQTLWDIFSSQESLANSWLQGSVKTKTRSLSKGEPGASTRKLTKEEVRTMEGESEKDVDSAQATVSESQSDSQPSYSIDLDSLRRSYEQLFGLDNSIFEAGLVNAIVMLCSNLEMDLKCKPNIWKDLNFLNAYLVVVELPVLGSEAYLENVVPVLCRGIALLPLPYQVVLAKLWSDYSASKLKSLLENLQQILSLKVYTGAFTRERVINEDETITSVTSVIRILYYASLLAGERDSSCDSWDVDDPVPCASENDNFAAVEIIPNSLRERYHDPMGAALQISPLDVRVPLIPSEEFYNEPLNETIEMDKDFSFWKISEDMGSFDRTKFSFMSHPFILNPATKTQALYYDNRIRMYSTRRENLFQSLMGGQSSPFLKLRVHRDRLIMDALVEIEMVVLDNPGDLKKQLMVEFDEEQGIDEGGLSKEFFQLIVEEMFNPDYGMFILDEETASFWFNPSSYENDAEFTLVGIILGLAIYNNVILDLHLPGVIYRKLSGKRGLFQDLTTFKPSVHRSLQSMLDYTGDDFEEVFCQPFQISYTDLFGSTITKELCDGGEERFVTKDNVIEYVDSYADFLLNKSVSAQFLAFQRGFSLVTAESPLGMLFNPAELEILICGEKEFDFNELESSTEYDGGFDKDTPAVKWFWELIHSMSLDDKRRLLQFTTGSDRIPIGGLAKLKLIITRNGPDSDRLPSAHTCFNVLLLPEYKDKEKLFNLTYKAIKECKGFGML